MIINDNNYHAGPPINYYIEASILIVLFLKTCLKKSKTGWRLKKNVIKLK